MKLSIIIPVYNEKDTVEELIDQVVSAPVQLEKQIIVVDDNSIDGSKEILKKLENERKIILIQHEKNQGKGAAIRSGMEKAQGDFILIQDADLEYDPKDYPALLEPLLKNKTDVVYGSRNLKNNPRSSLSFYLGGRFLTFFLNFLFRSKLTDINTCYKVFKKDILKEIELKENRFAFCEEVTCKLLKKKFKIKEVPIKYYPRVSSQGKKIKWKDGLRGMLVILKNRFF
jgi:dolichol-phosphate mannosyltransferase